MQPGDRVDVATTKWGGAPHWEFAARWLGADEHGEWLGVHAGTPHARPGAGFVAEVDSAMLVPREGWWFARFHAPGIWCTTYVDMATPPVREGSRVTTVDLDLDVIEHESGRWYVDDEDEFAEHRVSLGYPDEVADAAEHACRTVHAAATAGVAPYDGATGRRWLDAIAAIPPA